MQRASSCVLKRRFAWQVAGMLIAMTVVCGRPGFTEPPDKQQPELNSQVDQLLRQGETLYAQGQYATAIESFEQAVKICRQLSAATTPQEGRARLATALNGYGTALKRANRLPEAGRALTEALALRRALYPQAQYPQGHTSIATTLLNLGGYYKSAGDLEAASKAYHEAADICRQLAATSKTKEAADLYSIALNNLGTLAYARADHAEALAAFREVLKRREALYPPDKYPDGDAELATALNNVGVVLKSAGQLTEARKYLEQALEMRRRVYPPEEFPAGHPHLAESLSNLAALLNSQGESVAAIQLYKEALDYYDKVFPVSKYPQGHPLIAITLDNITVAFYGAGDPAAGQPYARRALQTFRKLLPAERFPNGHPALAKSLNNNALLEYLAGDFERANQHYGEAEAMLRKLLTPDKYPHGHPDLAGVLRARAEIARGQGDLELAERLFRESLDMYRALYPSETYPSGHSTMVRCLNGLGLMYLQQGRIDQAAEYLGQAVAMQQGLSEEFLSSASEAEALNFMALYRFVLDRYLMLEGHDAQVYQALWAYKGATFRALAGRRQALHRLTDERARSLYAHYLDIRAKLARRTLQPTIATTGRGSSLDALSGEKEQLERALAQFPGVSRFLDERETPSPNELAEALPPEAVFVDFIRYPHVSFDRAKPGDESAVRQDRYAAFLVVPHGPVARIDLGPAGPIDEAVDQWRRAILSDQSSAAPLRLRQLVWQPIEAHFGAEISQVYLCPDGRLTAVPWAALPAGPENEHLVLERYAVATVPHGPFLLDALAIRPTNKTYRGTHLLAVAGVDYGTTAPAGRAPTARQPQTGPTAPPRWDALPATRIELNLLRELAGPAMLTVNTLEGNRATVDGVLRQLSSADLAHFATHGFFAVPEVQNALRLDPENFRRATSGPRVSATGRNPLLLSGLVLAGANQASAGSNSLPNEAQGILTAEVIAGRNLDHLQLAVLSACETGLGEVAGGESVYGLARAFHLAGCDNVVASLWKVDDAATTALMGLFYRFLLEDEQSPIQALRHAQLELYRHPGQVSQVARARGITFHQPDASVQLSAADKERPVVLPPKLWAAFMLSGRGY